MTPLERLSFACYVASSALGASMVIGVILSLSMERADAAPPLMVQLILLVLIVAVEIAAQRILQERS